MQFLLLFGFFTLVNGISTPKGIQKFVRGVAAIVDDIDSITCVNAIFDLHPIATEDQKTIDEYCLGLPDSHNNSVFRGTNVSWSFQNAKNGGLLEKRLEKNFPGKKRSEWMSREFKKNIVSLFMDNEIPVRFAEEMVPDWIADQMGFGPSIKLPAMKGIRIIPESCKDSILRASYCFRSVEKKNLGGLYEITDPGYFTNNDTIYYHHLLNKHAVQITNGMFIPVDYEKCQRQGHLWYCEALATKCSVDNLRECPIHVFRADQDFVHIRSDTPVRIVATRTKKMSLSDGTKWTNVDVPSKLFFFPLEYGKKVWIGHRVLLEEDTERIGQRVKVFETESQDFTASEVIVLNRSFNNGERWEGKRSELNQWLFQFILSPNCWYLVYAICSLAAIALLCCARIMVFPVNHNLGLMKL